VDYNDPEPPAIVSSEKLNLSIGQKVYFEDENYQGNGFIHYLPDEKHRKLLVKMNGEECISVRPSNKRDGRARFVPIS
jgi:hypothetical protein